MSIIGYKSENHPQQTAARGALDEVDDRGTDQGFFDSVAERFGGFTLDAAAAPHNAKCERFYTRADDGLSQPWTGRVWCNPPYSRVPGVSDLGSWVRKAWDSLPECELIVMLVPANRVEQAWWQDHVEPFRDRPSSPLRVEFLRGRLRFDQPAHWVKPAKGDRPPFGCALLIWTRVVPPAASECLSRCGRNEPCPDPWHDRRVIPSADPICNERGIPESECPAHCRHTRVIPPGSSAP